MARKIQFRRGPDVDRDDTVLSNGEPGFSTDTKQLYIGDGETLGGVPVLMSKLVNVSTQTQAAVGARYLFINVTNLILPTSAPDSATLTVTLSPNAGATKDNPACVIAGANSAITDGTGNSDSEYQMAIPGVERTFIFSHGGWQIWR